MQSSGAIVYDNAMTLYNDICIWVSIMSCDNYVWRCDAIIYAFWYKNFLHSVYIIRGGIILFKKIQKL